MVLWGKNALEEALKSNKRIEKVYLQFGKYFPPEFIETLKKQKIKIQWAKKEELKKKAGTSKHQGIVILLSPVEICKPEALINKTIQKKSFFVILDRVTEPQNLGAIARTTEFFGGTGILLPEKESAPINETAIKASSGALLHLTISRYSNLVEAVKIFKDKGGTIVSLETGGENISKAKVYPPFALIVGSEGKGISEELLKISNKIVSIPGKGKTPSLNVSVATGIAVWELLRKTESL
ncbi:23S rRNA (guanosine2251-2'-O)-methyltransferase [Desulfurobacterium pacificum]|uniref:23S rRNA (Guanosine2251-2'-O)-methyltransferase n=1 Tax=Desulfurobacterium pacificum TaxID=240166 RepID=A0ABY1NW71_9BACT|nr:23S rRNA (guanosine(2251)-2'-O)-methyltransferase RlmB [Desulfurobacterium pacificum]SMP19101.1 23S rRNA (guanosine2251-2'-O)-methyltransferase [Desulfurobacterium pacificum]